MRGREAIAVDIANKAQFFDLSDFKYSLFARLHFVVDWTLLRFNLGFLLFVMKTTISKKPAVNWFKIHLISLAQFSKNRFSSFKNLAILIGLPLLVEGALNMKNKLFSFFPDDSVF